MSNAQTFEGAFKRLEEILEKLNVSEVNLDESVKLFEEADQLIVNCTKRLTEAERKIEMIVKNRNGGPPQTKEITPQS